MRPRRFGLACLSMGQAHGWRLRRSAGRAAGGWVGGRRGRGQMEGASRGRLGAGGSGSGGSGGLSWVGGHTDGQAGTLTYNAVLLNRCSEFRPSG